MTEYLEMPNPTLRQGDVILAPSVTLEPPASDGDAAPAPFAVGDVTAGQLWSDTADGLAPSVDLEARWSPVLILSHDCELEKQFNERVSELLEQGLDEAQAVAEASADPTLDPYVVVAPLLPYSEFDAARHAGIRNGQRIGVLPVDRLPGDGGDYAIDLFRPSTVAVELLPHAAKVASFAPASVFELRYKLSEAYASRDLAVLTELEAMVGHSILRVEALPRSNKKTALVLHLDNAENVHLEIRRPREELPAEVTRQPSPDHSG